MNKALWLYRALAVIGSAGFLALAFITLIGPLAGHLGTLWALSFPKPSSLQTVEREP